MDKVFDMSKYIEEYSRNSRMMFTWVYPSEVRSLLEKTVDLQVEVAKVANKTMVDNLAKLTPAK